MERKILTRFTLANGYQDIRLHIEDLFGFAVSGGTLNAVTDRLLPELQNRSKRDLDAGCLIVGLDAIHYKIKEKTVI